MFRLYSYESTCISRKKWWAILVIIVQERKNFSVHTLRSFGCSYPKKSDISYKYWHTHYCNRTYFSVNCLFLVFKSISLVNSGVTGRSKSKISRTSAISTLHYQTIKNTRILYNTSIKFINNYLLFHH